MDAEICEKNEMVSAKIYGRFLRVEISLSLTYEYTRKCSWQGEVAEDNFAINDDDAMDALHE